MKGKPEEWRMGTFWSVGPFGLLFPSFPIRQRDDTFIVEGPFLARYLDHLGSAGSPERSSIIVTVHLFIPINASRYQMSNLSTSAGLHRPQHGRVCRFWFHRALLSAGGIRHQEHAAGQLHTKGKQGWNRGGNAPRIKCTCLKVRLKLDINAEPAAAAMPVAVGDGNKGQSFPTGGDVLPRVIVAALFNTP